MKRLLVVAVAAVLCLPSIGKSMVPAALDTLGPFTHWYPDKTELQPESAQTDSGPWRDVIGEKVFDTKGIAAGWQDEVLHLALVTNFPDANVRTAGRPVAPADLALDLDGDGVLETGIVISDVKGTGDQGVTRADNIRQGAVYRVAKWHRPSDILQKTYGQGWRWSGPDGVPMQQSQIPVWIAEGTEREDLDVSVAWHRVPGSEAHAVLVTIAYPENPGRLHHLPVVWGTAVCGNDVVFSHVSRFNRINLPDPATVSAPNQGNTGPRWNEGLTEDGNFVPTSAPTGWLPDGGPDDGRTVEDELALINVVLGDGSDSASGGVLDLYGDGGGSGSSPRNVPADGEDITPVPLPPSLLLFGAVLAGFVVLGNRPGVERR